MRACSVLSLLSFLCCFSSAAQNTLSLENISSWPIVCDQNAIESERYAAVEFQTLFQEMTGHHLPIVDTTPNGGEAIYIGPQAVANSGLHVDDTDFGEEGLHIQIAKDAIHITGGRPRGTLYGIYEFFEHYCGVLFLTHDHTHFPEDTATRSLPLGTHRFTPTFAFRWSHYNETGNNTAFAARIRTNTVSDNPKLGGRTGYRLTGHNVAYLVPPSEYGESNPEYFALVDGRRKLQMHGGGPQLCMTNPKVLELLVQGVLKEIEKNPTVRNISVAHMDNKSYCTCDNCAAIDAREESHAGATLSMVNAVAERIEKHHPDVLISTYAYEYTRKPPKTIRVRHNVMIQLCSIECCVYHPIDDPSCALNRSFCDDTNGWKEKADNIFIWHYNTNFRGYLLPFPNLKSIGHSVDYFANNHGRGVFMQAATNTLSAELSDLRNFVMSRCLWKPGRNSWEEAQNFCRLHYAEAAGPILEYLEYYHNLAGETNLHPDCFPTQSSLAINAESAPRIAAYFEEALALAQSETIHNRVEKASLSAYRALLSVATTHLHYEDGLCKPHLEGVDANLLEKYADLCAKYGVSRDTEVIMNDTYLATMRKLFAGMTAAKIENEVWRVIVLPESNAKVIEITHKPSGRNIIQPARSLDRFRFEEWSRQGEGPWTDDIVPFEVELEDTRMHLQLNTPDGSQMERTIELEGDAIKFSTNLIAGASRPFDFFIHPEYDTASTSFDPDILSIYVRNPDWIHANAGWKNAHPTGEQTKLLRDGVKGGAFAYYNHEEHFGVEQRFSTKDIETMTHYWNPTRRQVNLELYTPVLQLEKGEEAGYAYEVRYLDTPPK